MEPTTTRSYTRRLPAVPRRNRHRRRAQTRTNFGHVKSASPLAPAPRKQNSSTGAAGCRPVRPD
eukprot:scaffold20868_cov79-Isochrysis_galbana.AAC.1